MLTKSVFLFLIFTLSCSTMRLQVKAPYQSSQGTGTLVYERTYDVGGGMPLWCALSAIYFGGACWAYLAMPFVPQQDRIIKDATSELNSKLGTTDASIAIPDVQRISWTSAEPFLELKKASE